MKQHKPRVCVVDKSEDTARFIETALKENYHVYSLNSAELFKSWIIRHRADVFILDSQTFQGEIASPIEAVKANAKNSGAIVIALVQKQSAFELPEAFKVGADDVLFKPFDFKELVARIAARERDRAQWLKTEKKLKFGSYTLNLESRTIQFAGKVLALPIKQVEILRFFIENRGRLISREEIFSSIWPSEAASAGYKITEKQLRTIDSYVRLLRKTMPALKNDLKSVYGKGYEFAVKRSLSRLAE